MRHRRRGRGRAQRWLAVAAAVSGLVLKAVWFNPWLLVGLLLDAGVLAAVFGQWPASLY
ncbi:hypothetical protein ACFYW6_34870 [Streptomyces sp. NPDC002659]|uniref:hypothetical protein n=1 Tax=Streptomyces sp. NPDC002659 TaxID=3364656 RepID=UPI003688127C